VPLALVVAVHCAPVSTFRRVAVAPATSAPWGSLMVRPQTYSTATDATIVLVITTWASEVPIRKKRVASRIAETLRIWPPGVIGSDWGEVPMWSALLAAGKWRRHWIERFQTIC
jgi:hypothetical protein